MEPANLTALQAALPHSNFTCIKSCTRRRPLWCARQFEPYALSSLAQCPEEADSAQLLPYVDGLARVCLQVRAAPLWWRSLLVQCKAATTQSLHFCLSTTSPYFKPKQTRQKPKRQPTAAHTKRAHKACHRQVSQLSFGSSSSSPNFKASRTGPSSGKISEQSSWGMVRVIIQQKRPHGIQNLRTGH